eukprot:GEMP01069924.1.p1 GENE.GEMP01069924.1~~GEMP01069924.1.p1  ORF type:complete len:241 (+),score=37.46 GEMP01069924.1:107-724(+)
MAAPGSQQDVEVMARWMRAQQSNPNPRDLLQGFQALVQRVQQQEAASHQLNQRLEDMQTLFVELTNHQKTHTIQKMRECKEMQVKLHRTLLEVMAQLEIYALSTGAARRNFQKQEELEGRLGKLEEAVSSAPSQFSLRVSELSYISRSLLENLGDNGQQPALANPDVNKIVGMVKTQGELIECATDELRKQQQDVTRIEAALKRR